MNKVSYSRCGKCNGQGFLTDGSTCPNCSGTGYVRIEGEEDEEDEEDDSTNVGSVLMLR